MREIKRLGLVDSGLGKEQGTVRSVVGDTDLTAHELRSGGHGVMSFL